MFSFSEDVNKRLSVLLCLALRVFLLRVIQRMESTMLNHSNPFCAHVCALDDVFHCLWRLATIEFEMFYPCHDIGSKLAIEIGIPIPISIS